MDWTSLLLALLALLGWTLLVRLFPNVMTKGIIKRIEHNYNSKLEELKGDIQASNSALRSSIDFLTASQSERTSRVLSSVESLWNGIETLEALHPSLGLLDILYPNELDALFRGQQGNIAIALEKYNDLNFIADTAEAIKQHLNGSEIIYVSNRLWLLYETLFRLHGRIAYLIHQSLQQKKYLDWRSDTLVLDNLRRVFPVDQIDDAMSQSSGGAKHIVSWLKAEFIKESRSIVQGSSGLAQSVSEIHSILKNEIDDRHQRSMYGLEDKESAARPPRSGP